jgi:uncharacterized protein YjcR
MMQQVNYPEEYVPFQMQQMNEQAYNNAVAYTAQFQSELRTIVVNNVMKEAHFVLEHQAMLLPNVLHTYHMTEKNSMRIVVMAQVFEVTQREIKYQFREWVEMLDPSVQWCSVCSHHKIR